MLKILLLQLELTIQTLYRVSIDGSEPKLHILNLELNTMHPLGWAELVLSDLFQFADLKKIFAR